MRFLVDRQRHLICVPYSIENLHRMAEKLGIKRCWFHKDHYDVPKRDMPRMLTVCELVRPREILELIKAHNGGI